MPSIRDLATLALDVYDREGNRAASSAGWSRIDGQNWTIGFAGGQYRKGSDVVVAFRGTDTDDIHDLVSDALMIPALSPGAAQHAVESVFREAGVHDPNMVTVLLPRMVEGFVSVFRHDLRSWADRVPEAQLRDALAYFDGCSPRPRFVTGHSLGGALAQLVSHERDVPTVAFNAPFMGTLRGAVLASSQIILKVNARGDFLSVATQAVGNQPHGRELVLEIAQPAATPPRLERRRLNPLGTLSMLVHREAEARARYNREYLSYLVDVVLHYHGMDNLLEAMGRDRRFSRPLRDDFSNI